MPTDKSPAPPTVSIPPSSESIDRLIARLEHTAQLADVATGVLHNVGNVLSSINVSSTLIEDRVKALPLEHLEKLAKLLQRPPQELSVYLAEDPKGRKVPEFLSTLAESLMTGREQLIEEIVHLRRNLQHLRGVIAAQQSYAISRPMLEEFSIEDLLSDALRISMGTPEASGIAIQTQYEHIARVKADKHRILQILINLLSNARHAVLSRGQASPTVTLQLRRNNAGRILIKVQDNGMGISEENLAKVFDRGFTTKPSGHGFGLHASATAAREIGGSISASSSGPGTGACFTLEFPPAPETQS